jgi:hypothetical protein
MKVLLVIAVLVACGKSKSECRTEAEALGKLLRELPHEPAPFMPVKDVKLVERADLGSAAIAYGPVVVVTASQLTFQGQLLRDPPELRGHLLDAQVRVREQLERYPRRGADPKRIYFQIDQGTPWPRVVEVVEVGGDAGFTAPGFVFAVAGPKPVPPPRTKIDKALDELQADDSGSEKATKLARMVEELVKDCPALQKSFGAVTEVEGESKADTLIRQLAPALIECECNADIPQLRSVMWRLLAVTEPMQVIAFDDALGGAPLAAPPAATWGTTAKLIAPGTKRRQFVVELDRGGAGAP